MNKLILLVSAILLIGCDTMSTVKYYNYSSLPSKKNYQWGYIYTNFSGKEKHIDNNISIVYNPYTLAIGFKFFKKYESNNIFIDELILFDKKETKKVLHKTNINMPIKHSNTKYSQFKELMYKFKLIQLDKKGYYIAFRLFKNIELLNYNELELTIKFHLNNDPREYIETFIFKTDYSEENISTWDMLMSV